MKQLAIILTLLLSSQVISQNFVMTWSNCYGGSADEKVGNIISAGEGFLMFGYSGSNDGDVSFNDCYGSAWLLGINKKGIKQFDKTFCGYNGAGGNSILRNGTEGYYLFGTTGPNNYGGINGYWFAKTDTNFDIVWQDVLGGSYAERPRKSCITNDEGILGVGTTGSNDGDIEEHFGDFDNWLVKMNSDGSRSWKKTYGNAGLEDCGNVISTNDNGYMFTSTVENVLPGNIYCEDANGTYAEGCLIKLAHDGNKEWHQCYGGSYVDGFKDVVDIDDGYIAVGGTLSADGDLNGHFGSPGESSDVWIVRTDLEGNIVWSKNYGGTDWDFGWKIFKNINNTFTIFGQTKSHNYDVQGNINTSNTYVIWMFVINENGDLIFQKPFGEINYLHDFPAFTKVSEYNYIAAVTRYAPDNCYYSVNNLNEDIYIFEIQDMDEFMPSQPAGLDMVCLENVTESYYSTQLVVDTMETHWLIIPEDAGTLSPMHDSVLIQWNQNFTDTALLQVRAINEYGESSFSEAKEIIVYPPLVLLNIAGPDSVCTANNQQSLFTTQIADNIDINWSLEPQIAGDINNQQDTAIINWNPTYEGMVSLKTSTLNPCDEEEYSPIKEVLVKSCMGLQENKRKELKIYPNPGKTQITFELPAITKESLLQIKDIFGKTIAELRIKTVQSQLKWNCSNISNGVYFYHTEIDGINYSGKILIQ